MLLSIKRMILGNLAPFGGFGGALSSRSHA